MVDSTARTVALYSALNDARTHRDVWAKMAAMADTKEACWRGRDMAALWDLVALEMARRVKRKGGGLNARPDIKYVADALVTSKLP